MPPFAWLGNALGALLAMWAISTNRPGNFNIRPEPRQGGLLVQRGPYRWIRHPMYTAVIVCGLACAWVSGTAAAWLAASALVAVLFVKANFEEQWMREVHPEYATYSLQTKRFFPWMF